MLEEEQRGRDEAREAASKAERRVGEINSELEDLRGQLEQVWWSYLPLVVLAFLSANIVDNRSLLTVSMRPSLSVDFFPFTEPIPFKKVREKHRHVNQLTPT